MRPSPLSRWLLLAAALLAAPAGARGVRFLEGSYEDALRRAQAEKKNLLVEVYATWCGPCKRQAAQVFETDDGLALTRNLIAWRVDFDAEASRPLMERWAVLNLPTVLFLRPDGTEIDRIEGYDDRDAFLQEAEARARGLDPLPELERRLAAAEKKLDEKERVRLLVEVGHRYLVRGDAARGIGMLDRAAIFDRRGKLGAAEDALFVLGRYYSRAKRDFATARNVWRELYTRFPSGKYAATAAWWYTGALHELGDDALAVDVLARRIQERPLDTESLDLLVSYVEERGFGREQAARALAEAKGKVPEPERLDFVERLEKAKPAKQGS